MLCPVCGVSEAQNHPVLGVLPCLNCKARRDTQRRPDFPVEFTSDQIKSDRRQYASDIIQPFRGNEASREFIDAFPGKAKEMFTEKERKTAKKVWID